MSHETVIALLYTTARKPKAQLWLWRYVLFRSLRHKMDPLDLEILERAFDVTLGAIKERRQLTDFDSDEGLEPILRQELIEMACLNGVSDPETLRDSLLARLSESNQ